MTSHRSIDSVSCTYMYTHWRVYALSGFVIALGIIPANAKHTQPYLQLIADEFDSMIDGLPVYDAYERRQVSLIIYLIHHVCMQNYYI